MRHAELAILYQGDSGRPLTVARVDDRRLLVAAAEAAIQESRDRATQLAEVDAVLGAVEQEDAERLRRVLGILLPEVSEPPTSPAAGTRCKLTAVSTHRG